MTKLAIFDLDGTLLNTIEDLAESCNHALTVCGFPARDLKEYNLMVGRGIYNLFRAALPEEARTEENVKRMAEVFIPYYDIHKCDLTRPYDGIKEMLDALSRAGVGLAVASNKYQEGAEGVVSHYFPDVDFVKVLGQSEGRPIKPSPEIVEEIMREAGVTDKGEVAYIGDSDVDMMTGANAGVRTIGVTWGFRSREELLEHNPWRTVDTPQELMKILL
ncbi:MAG: HAD family hydrolase [Candidatus Cryptobacteroides sp.]